MVAKNPVVLIIILNISVLSTVIKNKDYKIKNKNQLCNSLQKHTFNIRKEIDLKF